MTMEKPQVTNTIKDKKLVHTGHLPIRWNDIDAYQHVNLGEV